MFPQQGLVPRDPSRGDAVKRAVFCGCKHQLLPTLRTPLFAEQLRKLGVSFDVVHKGRAQSWRDYEEADLVIAVREPDASLHASKPPSKLVNSWLAGVPFICGPESAPRGLREDPLDYVEVDPTPVAVLAAVAAYVNDPARYAAARRRCAVRAAGVGRAALAGRWAALAREISEG